MIILSYFIIAYFVTGGDATVEKPTVSHFV